MSDEKKKSGFTVSDRRLFTEEGELRPDAPPDAPVETQEEPPTPEAAAPPAPEAEERTSPPEVPPLPTAAEQEASSTAYRDAHAEVDKALNEALGTQHQPESLQA